MHAHVKRPVLAQSAVRLDLRKSPPDDANAVVEPQRRSDPVLVVLVALGVLDHHQHHCTALRNAKTQKLKNSKTERLRDEVRGLLDKDEQFRVRALGRLEVGDTIGGGDEGRNRLL